MGDKGKSQSGAGGRPLAKPTADLLVQFERQLNKVLEPLLQNYFGALGETLRKLSEGGDVESQSAYLDAMRSIKSQSASLQRAYLKAVEKPFRELGRGATAGKAGKLSLDSLSLVDDQNLEVDLIAKGISQRVRNAYNEELDGIADVLGRLFPKVEITDRNNPLAPKLLVDALTTAFEPIQAPMLVRMSFYRVFDQEVAAHLSKLYVELDHMLVSRNLVDKERSRKKISNPEVKRRDQPKEKEGDKEDGKGKGEGGGEGKGGEGGGSGGGGGGEIVDTLKELLSSGVFGGPAHAGPTAETTQVNSALNAFQSKALSIPAGTDPEAIGQRVKEQLNGVIQKMTGNAELGVGQMDNAMIDVVSMIFDYILEDQTIPDSVKALVSRLQIPLLKVAIVDKTFFGNPDHPARRLVNMLARSGVGIGEDETEKTNSTLNAISTVVHKVLQEFRDDVGLFEKLNDSFEKFIDARDRKEEEKAAKAAKEAQAREDVQIGYEEVESLVADRLADNPELPEVMVKLLTGPWKKAILNAAATEGLNGRLWDQRVELVDELIASVTPTDDPAVRKQLGSRIPAIVTSLREGLEEIEVAGDKIEALLNTLQPIHFAIVSGKGGKKPSAPVAQKPAEESSPLLSKEEEEFARLLAETESSLAELDEELEAPPMDPELFADWGGDDDLLKEFNQEPSDPRLKKLDPASQPDDEFLEQARDLEVGQWLYLLDNEGEKVRAKLGWKSDYLGEYSFMNWKFKVVAEMSLYNLAAELRNGNASVIEKTPLMERALEAVTGFLKRKKAPAAEADVAES